MNFCYDTAFARNLGLVNEAEQLRLKQTRIALPGLGGVGGAHLQALARMGVGAFNLADPDTFDLVNLNRQLCADMTTLGRPKTEVAADVLHSINPLADVKTFSDGINANSIAEFLKDVDIVVDGIEFFCLEARRMLYRACRERGIPVVNAGPIGYGSAVLVFMPDGISFDEYFRIDDDMTRAEQLLSLALGLAPGLIGDVDPSRVDIENEKGPALASACMLCAAAAATEVLKLVCKRGRLCAVPHATYFDPYRAKTVRLRPRPSLRSLTGRVLRWLSFRKFPAFQAMHDREIAERQRRNRDVAAPSPVNASV